MGIFNKRKTKEDKKLNSPLAGKVIDVKETKDPVFNSGCLGKGVGILPEETILVAPIAGKIVSFFPTKHAIGIETEAGVEILIHVGINTVELNGKYFKAYKKQGDKVKQGEALLEIDFKSIENEGYDPTVIMVITNTKNYQSIQIQTGNKTTNDIIIEIEE